MNKNLLAKIRRYALFGGGIYRMNCSTATCYAFRINPKGYKNMDGTINKKDDWEGGWDWFFPDGTIQCDTEATHYIRLSDGKLITIK